MASAIKADSGGGGGSWGEGGSLKEELTIFNTKCVKYLKEPLGNYPTILFTYGIKPQR